MEKRLKEIANSVSKENDWFIYAIWVQEKSSGSLSENQKPWICYIPNRKKW